MYRIKSKSYDTVEEDVVYLCCDDDLKNGIKKLYRVPKAGIYCGLSVKTSGQ